MSAARSLHPSPRTLEVESLDSFDRLVAAGAKTMQGWHAQSLDLRGRTAQLAAMHAQGGIFLGCTFDAGVEDVAAQPRRPDFPQAGGGTVQPVPRAAVHPAGALRGDLRLTL